MDDKQKIKELERELGIRDIERELAPSRELIAWIANLLRNNSFTSSGRIVVVGEDSDGIMLEIENPDEIRHWVITLNDLTITKENQS